MDDISFRVSGYSSVSSDVDFQMHKGNGFTLCIFGEVFGAIIGEEVLSEEKLKERLLSAIEKHQNIDELVGAIVGEAFLIISNDTELDIFCTLSAPALYFHKEKSGEIIFSNNEKWIYGAYGSYDTLDEKEVVNSILSHHILARNPFDSLFENIKKLIPGSKIRLAENQSDIDLFFLNYRQKQGTFSKNSKRFGFLLEQTLTLIKKDEEKKIILLKSGGIDSAVLLAALGKIDCLHVPYSGVGHPSVTLAESIVKDFDNKLILAKQKERMSLDYLRKRGEEGFGTIAGPQYLTVDFAIKDEGELVHAFSGQNLDTLYYVDTFAPLSTITGYKRAVYTFLKIPYRVVYYWMFHSKKWRFLLTPILRKKEWRMSFKTLIDRLARSYQEHTMVYEKEKFPKGLEALSEMYQKNRDERLSLPVTDLMKRKFGKDLEDFNSSERLTTIKTLRWCRTIHNVPTMYQNIRRIDDLERMIVYNHGPLASFFMNYRLTIREMFTIKPLSHRYFQSKMKPYSSYVKELGLNPSWTRGIVSKLKRVIQRPIPVVPQKALSLNKEMDILVELLSNQRLISVNFKTPEAKMLFDFWMERISNHRNFSWTKDMAMMACRFVNMQVFLNNILNNDNSAK